jgi:hypothetical protein
MGGDPGRIGDAVLELAHAVRVDGVEGFEARSPLEREALRVARVWSESGGDLRAVGDALKAGTRRLVVEGVAL